MSSSIQVYPNFIGTTWYMFDGCLIHAYVISVYSCKSQQRHSKYKTATIIQPCQLLFQLLQIALPHIWIVLTALIKRSTEDLESCPTPTDYALAKSFWFPPPTAHLAYILGQCVHNKRDAAAERPYRIHCAVYHEKIKELVISMSYTTTDPISTFLTV